MSDGCEIPLPCTTPVVFIIFRRPSTTRAVFDTIAKARPEKLFIVADGPRNGRPEDRALCAETRGAVERITWPCEVRRDYAEDNMGCARRVASGLDWVFSHVDRAIILEDDCLPDQSFFAYCAEVLERFQDDERIMHVSGDSFTSRPVLSGPYSYYFSRYVHIWGWATWKRAWRHYQETPALWPVFRKEMRLRGVLRNPWEVRRWTGIFDRISRGEIDTWDFWWVLTCWMQGGLSVMPKCNMVRNIGFGGGSSRTFVAAPWATRPLRSMLLPLMHPAFVMRDVRAERASQWAQTCPRAQLARLWNRFAGLRRRL